MKKLIILGLSVFSLAFGEVSDRQLKFAALSADIAMPNLENFKLMAKSSLENGVKINELKELIAHDAAYLGFPRALNALNALNEVTKGQNYELGKAREIKPDSDFYAKGVQMLSMLLGQKAPELLQNDATFDFMLKSYLFGFLFDSHILSPLDREIIVISVLSSLDGVEAQLKSHLKIAKNLGLEISDFNKITSNLEPKTAKNLLKNLKEIR
ncbi:carboxymuconolactone decarboxylase family protein [Campylobacter mucosalis]|uniref:carboxymuconolactone decarboxylase family protein n=1 Tax=Campylobacter mucosalis TaxID=202 RepID=UPI0014704212|nr:carboxymuconolactone decarboxylase family protein [Campylobacter mucosalis]